MCTTKQVYVFFAGKNPSFDELGSTMSRLTNDNEKSKRQHVHQLEPWQVEARLFGLFAEGGWLDHPVHRGRDHKERIAAFCLQKKSATSCTSDHDEGNVESFTT